MRRTPSEMDSEKRRENSVVCLSNLKVEKACGSKIMPFVFGRGLVGEKKH